MGAACTSEQPHTSNPTSTPHQQTRTFTMSSNNNSSNDNKIVLVTGANKGIGFEFVRLVSSEHPTWTVLLGARSQANGDEAVAKLAKLGQSNVRAVLINVSEDASVKAAAASVQKQYGRVDVLVNNAGVSSMDPSTAAVVTVLQTNLYGVKRVVDAFLPLIPADGRIIVVSSEVGSWTHQAASKALQAQLTDKALTWEQIDALTQRYIESTRPPAYAHKDEFAAGSFGSYGISKMMLSAWGRVTAPQLLASRNISLQLVCPGFCATDLNHNTGHRTSEQGARSFMAALQRDSAKSGRLYQDDREVAINEPVPQYIIEMLAKMKAQREAQH